MHPGDAMIGRWNARAATPKERFKTPELSPRYTAEDGSAKIMTPEQFGEFALLSGKIADKLFQSAKFDVEQPSEGDIQSLRWIFESSKVEARKLLRTMHSKGNREFNLDNVAALMRYARIRSLKTSLQRAMERRTSDETDAEFATRKKKYFDDRKLKLQELNRLRAG